MLRYKISKVLASTKTDWPEMEALFSNAKNKQNNADANIYAKII